MKIKGFVKIVGFLKFRNLVGYENLHRGWLEYDSQVWDQLQ